MLSKVLTLLSQRINFLIVDIFSKYWYCNIFVAANIPKEHSWNMPKTTGIAVN